uniref:Uncharacterized protein n=1 Tax=Panagrolaimus sp. PS1159 TaxID=55785 RepID=A0AC35FFQ1_9BILA
MKTYAILSFVVIITFTAADETFLLKADRTIHLILPYFTNVSSFEDFNQTFQFLVTLDDHPKDLCLYSPDAYNQNWSQSQGIPVVICNSQKVKCFIIDSLESNDKSWVKREIFGEYLDYTLDYTQNAYNFFIIANESELSDHVSIAYYLHTYANEKSWDFSSSISYIAVIERNDSMFYESGK